MRKEVVYYGWDRGSVENLFLVYYDFQKWSSTWVAKNPKFSPFPSQRILHRKYVIVVILCTYSW